MKTASGHSGGPLTQNTQEKLFLALAGHLTASAQLLDRANNKHERDVRACCVKHLQQFSAHRQRMLMPNTAAHLKSHISVNERLSGTPGWMF